MTLYNKKHDVVIAMIREQMVLNDYTISDISKKTGIARSQIHNWINGTAKKIRDSSLGKVAEKLNYKLHTTDQGIKLEHKRDKDNEDIMINQMQQQITELQAEKIKWLEEKLEKLEKKNSDKLSNGTFENMDYDIITHQTYNVDCDEPYKWFTNYEIIRWKYFCEKLGYVGQEAVDVHNYIQATSRNLKDYKGKNYNVVEKDRAKFAIYDHVYTKQFFQNAKLKHFINAVESYHVNYIHKDGSSLPAVIFVYYDIKGDSSVSKIKFLNNDN